MTQFVCDIDAKRTTADSNGQNSTHDFPALKMPNRAQIDQHTYEKDLNGYNEIQQPVKYGILYPLTNLLFVKIKGIPLEEELGKRSGFSRFFVDESSSCSLG